MSEYKQTPNNGSLFTQKTKKNASSPDITGKMMLKKSDLEFENFTDEDGNSIQVARIRLSAWRKKTKAGDTYLSLSLNTWKPEEERVQPKKIEEEEPKKMEEQDDDIPF